MKEFYNFIAAFVIANNPAIFTVRYWNFQPDNSNDAKVSKNGYASVGRQEKAFRYPACFIEFVFDQADNRCLGIVDYIMTINFRFAVEGYTFDRLTTMDMIDTFASTMQLMAPPTGGTPLTFTTFQEVSRGTFESSFDNVENLMICYTTRFRSFAGQSRQDYILAPQPLSIDTTQVIP